MTIFQKIINRELNAYIVYEDDLVIAFLDISQVTKGHTLVVPKEPFENVYELDEKTAGHLFKVVVKVSKALKKAFNLEGLNIVNNNGKIAGQAVFHYHIHLIPRYVNDDYRIKGIDHNREYSHEDFLHLKARIVNAQS